MPSDPKPLDQAAWIRATCPDDKVRDGRRAVEGATKAADLTKRVREATATGAGAFGATPGANDAAAAAATCICT